MHLSILKIFCVALGYKASVVKEYFLNYNSLNADFTVDLKTGALKMLNAGAVDWKVTLIDTGLETLTNCRVKQMKPYVKNEAFFLTYGDGVADIDLNDLVAFHKSHGKLMTMTAVRPKARFGELQINNNQVIEFREKPQLGKGWINGFFICEPGVFDFIDDENKMFEREPIEKIVKAGQLMSYKHEGFCIVWIINAIVMCWRHYGRLQPLKA